MTTSNVHNRIKLAQPVTPFLKWPGGKRWLTRTIINTLSSRHFRTYYEPFVGGGAVFFALRPSNAVLTDINDDLINTYYHVKHYPSHLIARLKEIPVTRQSYYNLRENTTDNALERAVRFLFLNRTAFGGMYRLNKSGKFNVPFGGGGRTPDPLWKRDLIFNASHVLQDSTLIACDFETTISNAGPGDLIYCDPTYTVAHNNNGFIRYNENNFSWLDQQRLAACCKEAVRRGVFIIITNAFHDEVLALFDPPKHTTVTRYNCLCPDPIHRGSTQEYLFIYEPTSLSLSSLLEAGAWDEK